MILLYLIRFILKSVVLSVSVLYYNLTDVTQSYSIRA